MFKEIQTNEVNKIFNDKYTIHNNISMLVFDDNHNLNMNVQDQFWNKYRSFIIFPTGDDNILQIDENILQNI